MKKVLIISGSYREDGDSDTDLLINNFKDGLKEKDPKAIIEIVELKRQYIEYCLACRECGSEENIKKPIGDCPIEDSVRPLLKKSLACDVLVYVTPIYEKGPTAAMKKFLERNYPLFGKGKIFAAARHPKRKDKVGVIITSSGAPYPFNKILGFVSYTKKILSLFCRLYGCGRVYELSAGGMDIDEKNQEKWAKKAYNLGKKI